MKINPEMIMEGDHVLVVNDKESGWFCVDEIDCLEHWVPRGSEHYSVRYEPIFHVSDEDGKEMEISIKDIEEIKGVSRLTP